MATNPAQSRYLVDAVSTATPAQLVVMLYDRLVLDLLRANQALIDANSPAASGQLLHAQQILAELLATLKIGDWDGAQDLASLYGYLIRELVAVNIEADRDRLGSCSQIVNGLRSAWHDAAAQLSAGSARTAAAAFGAGSAAGGGATRGAWVA